jgi:hypothetical protein
MELAAVQAVLVLVHIHLGELQQVLVKMFQVLIIWQVVAALALILVLVLAVLVVAVQVHQVHQLLAQPTQAAVVVVHQTVVLLQQVAAQALSLLDT